jgi:hypothetical protein
MKNKKTFRKGQVVKCKTNVVLVTGKGNKNEGDTTFAGLVIMAKKKDEKDVWPVGMHSDTWITEAFEKVDIKLSKLLADALNSK